MSELEPVELYLQETIDPDKLALYQPILDIFKKNEIVSSLDAINILVSNINDQPPSEVVAEIHKAFVEQISYHIAQFDVVVETNNLRFLYDLYSVLLVLDGYFEHRFIYNTCLHATGNAKSKLYEILNIVKYFDELEYSDSVSSVSYSFINKLAEIHYNLMEEQEDLNTEAYDFSCLAKVLKYIKSKQPSLLVFDLIDKHQVTPGTPVKALTNLATEIFAKYNETVDTSHETMKHLAKEVVALYCLNTCDKEKLKEIIFSESAWFLDVETEIVKLNAFIPTTIQELINE